MRKELQSWLSKIVDGLQDSPPPLFVKADADSSYQAYSQWRHHWLNHLRLCKQLLLHYPINPIIFDRWLGTQWTALIPNQIGSSFFDYQQGLMWLQSQLNDPSMAIYKIILGYHRQTVISFLTSNRASATQYFYHDLVNHLVAHSLDEQSANFIKKLLEFYKPYVSEDLFHKIEVVVVKGLEKSEQLSEDDPYAFPKAIEMSRVVTVINSIFKETVLTSEHEQRSSQNYSETFLLSSVLGIFAQGLRYIQKHPFQALLLGFAVNANTAAASPPLNARGIGDAFVISTDLNVNGTQSSLAVDAFPFGGVVTAYERFGQDGSGWGVFARGFANDDVPLGPELPMNNFTLGDQRAPSIATFMSGFIGAWESFAQDGPFWGVFARRFDNNFMPVSSIEFPLSNNSAVDRRRPKIDAWPNGEFSATWEQFDVGSGWSVRSRQFGSNDLPIGLESELSDSSTDEPRNPQLATSQSDDVVTIWQTNVQQAVNTTAATPIGDLISNGGLAAAFDGNKDQARSSCAYRPSFGPPGYIGINIGLGNEFIPTGIRTWASNDNGYNSGGAYLTTMTVLVNNNQPLNEDDGTQVATIVTDEPDINNANPKEVSSGFLAVPPSQYLWVKMDPQGGQPIMAEMEFLRDINTITFQGIINGGAYVTPKTQVNNFTLNIQSNPTVAFFPDGSFAAAWNSLSQNVMGTTDIYFQRYDNNSNPMSTNILVNPNTMGNQGPPAIVTFPFGRSFVFWGSDSGNVLGQFINEISMRVGDEFLVEPNTNGTQRLPKATRNTDDNLFVSWIEQQGNDMSVYGKTIDTHLSASGTNQTITYLENTIFNLASIVVIPPTFVDSVTVTLTLSDVDAGTLLTGTAGTVTSTFNVITGVWEANGPASDINILLNSLQCIPKPGYNSDFTVAVDIQDGLNVLNDTIQISHFVAPTTTVPISSSTSDTQFSSSSITTTTDTPVNSATSEAGSVVGLIVGLIVGGLALIGGVAATITALYCWKRRQYSAERNSALGTLEMEMDSRNSSLYSSGSVSDLHSSGGHSLDPTRLKAHTVIGNKYVLISKISSKEAQSLFEKTGYKITVPPQKRSVKVEIDRGQFGKLGIACDKDTEEFYIVKKIKGKDAIEESRDEVLIQKKLRGKPNILPLVDSVELNIEGEAPILYLFLPLASFGSGKTLMNCFLFTQDNVLKTHVLTYVAKQLLIGLQAMHELGIYHKDLKPANFVIDNLAKVWIIDFGCAGEPRLMKGDSRYFSPERLHYARYSNTSYDGGKADAWALGVTLLEMVMGEYPFPAASYKERVASWDVSYFKKCLEKIPDIGSPQKDSLWDLIKGLLMIDPKDRLSIEQALKHPALAAASFASDEDRINTFSNLKLACTSVPLVRTKENYVPKTQDENYVIAPSTSGLITSVSTVTNLGIFRQRTSQEDESQEHDYYQNEDSQQQIM